MKTLKLNNMCIRSQKGASLVEVLVATVVVSVGLIGLAGLQTLSMQSNHTAYLRTQASLLAYDMVDRMRPLKKNQTKRKPLTDRQGTV